MVAEATEFKKGIYINGNWYETDATLRVTDLADGGTIGEVAAATPDHARQALSAADDVTAELRQTSVVERATWCEKIAGRLIDRREELADIIIREAGKPVTSAHSEIDAATERFRRGAEEARTVASKGEFREGTTAGHEGWNAIVKHEPIGTVLCIAPYNYPLATTALQIAPAIAAGNSIILKPASKTPISGAILAAVIDGIDAIPDGAFNFVPGRSDEIGSVLTGDDRIDCIAMTGSSSAGERIATESNMVTLKMELGGNAPALVLEKADLDAVASACTKGSLKYAGQRCSAISRVLVHESVHDQLVACLKREMDGWEAGDLFAESTIVGPLISASHVDWVAELVDDARKRGAVLVRGGTRLAPEEAPPDLADQFFEPTLLTDVPHNARIMTEEQFGPVVAVTPFEDREQAIRLANDSALALDAAVFTSDYDSALEIADQINAGSVRINDAPSHGIGDIPFGGNGQSGIGREGLETSIHAMMRKKSIVL